MIPESCDGGLVSACCGFIWVVARSPISVFGPISWMVLGSLPAPFREDSWSN